MKKEMKMEEKEIKKLIEKEENQKIEFRESETTELKTSTSELKEAINAIVAILNKHQKGEVYFGIKNDGRVIGQNVSDKTLREVAQTISDNIEPKIFPYIKRIEVEGKSCLKVSFNGQECPYLGYGRAYIRVGTENKQLSAAELRNIIINKNKGFWEKQISDKSLEDVNTKIVREYIKRANEVKRIDFKFTNIISTLNKLQVLHGRRLLNAAEVLFCNNNPLEVQVAVFAGTDKITFLDIQQLKGTLFDTLKKSESYIKEHMNWRADLSGSQRIEIPEVPLRALKEALVNSLCHRDYTNPKGNEIAIFKNRIEIYNPGQFPEEVKIEDYLRGEERSILRNPLISNALFLSKDIERWGSGLKRIYDECKANNIKVEFKPIKTGFLIIFYRPEKVPEKVPEKRPERIKELIVINKKITIPELARAINVNEKTIKRDIEKLKTKGLLKRIGPDKGGYWQIIENKKG